MSFTNQTQSEVITSQVAQRMIASGISPTTMARPAMFCSSPSVVLRMHDEFDWGCAHYATLRTIAARGAVTH